MIDPLRVAVQNSVIKEATTALEIGLENTRELLVDHDTRLGRTTRSDRHTAERLEVEVQQISVILSKFKEITLL